MKLIRVKLTDTQPFRSLQPGFEYRFRSEWEVDEELNSDEGVSPFVCAGRNGSGKSNLLELLAAIFFQIEVLRVRRSFLPEAFFYDAETNPDGIKDGDGIPNAFELEYLISKPTEVSDFLLDDRLQHVRVTKTPGRSPHVETLSKDPNGEILVEDAILDNLAFLLPAFVVGYSSGENEILSLPFFKTRFIQFDEYWNVLKRQLAYDGRPDTRLAYLDNEFSQAIFLCNLLYSDSASLEAFHEDVGIKELREFRIIIKRSIFPSDDVLKGFGERNPAFKYEEFRQGINMMYRLEADDDSAKNFDPIVTRLKRCATCHYTDPKTDTLYLDYLVNDATREAFSDNFDFKVNQSPIALFQAFQVLLSLNLFSVSDQLKADLYKSDSHYVSETVPTLASDERIMRFKFVQFTKEGVDEPVMLKSLSDGEHQLLHSLGLCLLFKNTNSLFLLDEPETHFNPDWRSSFISRLRKCFGGSKTHEILITTHSPFLISDSSRDRVLVFSKEDGKVKISHPEYKTLGASINFITAETFLKKETIGRYAESQLEHYRERFDKRAQTGEDTKAIIADLHRQLGDSIEKVLLIQSMLEAEKETE